VVGLDSLGSALGVVADLRRRVPELEAAEIVFSDGVSRVSERFGVASVVDPSYPCQLLVEAASVTADDEGLVERLGAVIGAAGGSAEGSAEGSAVAVDASTRERLWAVRERHPELVVHLGQPHKLDVSLPLRALARFESGVREALAGGLPGVEVVLYGHLGDGGLHVNVAWPPTVPADPGWTRRADEIVLGLVGSLGGSVSAEHGIGTEKVDFVGLTRGPAELDVMRGIKAALDPTGLFNPGVLFGGGAR